MDIESGVCEHWTITGRCLVLTGGEPAITSIAAQLDLPASSIIAIGRRRASVALWGNALSRYTLSTRPQTGVQPSAETLARQTDTLISSNVV